MNILRHVPPLVLAGVIIVVCQVHGAPWWVSLFGSAAIGWAVSLAWEGLSVWLWWRGDRTWRHRLVKWAATAALVWGMIGHSLSGPLRELSGAFGALGVLDVLRGQTELGHWVSQTTLKGTAKALENGAAALVSGAEALSGAWWFPALYAGAILALTTVAREIRPEQQASDLREWLNPIRFKSYAREDPAGLTRFAHGGGSPSPQSEMGTATAIAPVGREPQSEPASVKSGRVRRVRAFAGRHGIKPSGVRAFLEARGEDVPKASWHEFVNGKSGPENTARFLKLLEG